jgi:hypothetical protein
MTALTDPDLFPAAAEVIEHRGWAKGTLETAAGAVCATGAVRYCDLQPGEWLVVRAVMRHRDHAEEWNDEDERTEADVLGWLRTADPITDAELAEVFGPQWEPIVALIHRAAVLTEDEAKRMDATRDAAWAAARDAAWAAARDAAWAAARDATRDAAWAAAWAAAWDATWDATRAAAWDATRALVVRDVLDPQHYRTLIHPWASVIGPVHPEDA